MISLRRNDDPREEIYRNYYHKVLGYARSHITNSADAEDLAADVFLKVYQHLDEFDETRSSISTWIYSITRNMVVDYYRKNREVLPIDEEMMESVPDQTNQYDDLLTDLADELAKLPQKQRDAIIMFYYYGLDHKEIAKKMGISYDSARKLCSLGIIELRKKMNAS